MRSRRHPPPLRRVGGSPRTPAPGVLGEGGAHHRPAAAPLAGIDADHRDGLVFGVVQEAAHQFVDQRGLPRAAGAGDTQHGDRATGGQLGDARRQGLVRYGQGLGQGDRAGDGLVVALGDAVEQRRVGLGDSRKVAALHDDVDHALQPQRAPVVRREDAVDAVCVQLVDLVGQDTAAAAAVDLHVRAGLGEQVVHVLQEFEMTALVRSDGDALGVLLDGAVHDVAHRHVVAQVDHLGAAALQDAAHDVDGRVVAVEEGGGGYDADVVDGLVTVGHR